MMLDFLRIIDFLLEYQFSRRITEICRIFWKWSPAHFAPFICLVGRPRKWTAKVTAWHDHCRIAGEILACDLWHCVSREVVVFEELRAYWMDWKVGRTPNDRSYAYMLDPQMLRRRAAESMRCSLRLKMFVAFCSIYGNPHIRNILKWFAWVNNGAYPTHSLIILLIRPRHSHPDFSVFYGLKHHFPPNFPVIGCKPPVSG